ncbi:MAG: MFS transporter [Archangium gephyra]|uniref:MFS transporter n=1 Tax=Archangium gephyra TaxID=48 RepID=A0A2W5TFZ1_9BACT|nr:MAG: MFS transporter [Archangium gephyra]
MPDGQPSEQLTSRQWGIVWLIAAVQFINILDFVMVMPLGPDFAASLGISESQLGNVGGAYTAAACVSGLVGSLFLDRFDRRKALAVAMLGLVIGTAAGGFAFDLPTLLFARVLAGAFGGPATSLSFSIIADTIPANLRGRAMGTVMGAFSIASILGVPVGLWLAEAFSWRAPFLGVAAAGLIVCGCAIFLLPPMTSHLERTGKKVSFAQLISDPLVQLSYLMTAVVMFAGFVLIPNIAAYLQLNLGFPRHALKYAYGAGGVASLFATQLGGRLVDRFGSFRVGTFGALLVMLVVFLFFYLPHPHVATWLVLVAFVGFMLANGLRNVSYNTLTTKVPAPEVRARFTSIQSAVQHGASALSAMLSAQLLSVVGEGPERHLDGMPVVSTVSIALSALVPVMLFVVERGVKRRNALKAS